MFKKKKNASIKKPRNLVTLSDSQSIIAEQFRTIRANINFSLPEKELKTILVTSSTPAEGKSTNAANLAIVFAQEGKKVLLIDADMRKPSLHYTFNLDNTIGLSNILSMRNYLENGIQETPIVGLHIISSGQIPPNPAELLSSKQMDDLLIKVSEIYDLIMIDSPPVLTVSDPLVLANKCDGTLLVVNSGVSEKQNVVKSKEMLQSSKAKILGVVLNNYKVPPKLQSQYYQYYLKEK